MKPRTKIAKTGGSAVVSREMVEFTGSVYKEGFQSLFKVTVKIVLLINVGKPIRF